MRYFLLVSLSLLLFSCNRQTYGVKKEVTLSQSYTANDLRPRFTKELYRCVVDGKFALKKFHLSGLLYLKNFDDGNTRVIFQSEMGSTFFDFGWNKKDSFQVFSIMDDMNKAALIKTLKKDFEMLLVKNVSDNPVGIYQFGKNPKEYYTRFNLEKGFVYYVTDQERKLISVENADDKKKVIVMDIRPAADLQTLPEKITIRHLLGGFTIDLKKIHNDDTVE
jgi:hypothetical protein